MLNPKNEPIIEQYRSLAGPHLVTMSWFQQKVRDDGSDIGDARPYSISGFVMSLGEEWLFVTSGHIFEEQKRILDSGDEVMRSCSLAATLPEVADSEDFLPFDYLASQHTFWAPEDASQDCGVVLLDERCRTYLKSKNIRPLVGEKAPHWQMHGFDYFVSIGIPKTRHIPKFDADGQQFAVFQPTIMPLKPSELRDPDFGSHHFFLEPIKPLMKEQIDGMSGSPIFGTKKVGKVHHYGVCAIQSNYSVEHGLVIGFPSNEFVPLIQAWLAEEKEMANNEDKGEFNADSAVRMYREAVALRDDAATPEKKAEYEDVLAKLRKVWRSYSGSDNLEEMVSGEPVKEKAVAPNQLMSSDFEWDLVREERTVECFRIFDVKKAKEIIQANPREIAFLDLIKHGKAMRKYLGTVGERANVDWDKVDLRIPVIYAQADGERLPIDGRHRLMKALRQNEASIPIVWLTEEETKEVRII